MPSRNVPALVGCFTPEIDEETRNTHLRNNLVPVFLKYGSH